jgi:hypothetical protein
MPETLTSSSGVARGVREVILPSGGSMYGRGEERA